jgi:phage shock protein PspC (stress-responsive transcriptional regulator)
MQVNRRLYRCRHDQRIAGVASGIAEYFDADPTVVRILWVLSIFLGGFGLLLYIAMSPHRHLSRGGDGRGTLFVGMALVLFGALALIDAYLPAWADHGRFLWPAFILGIGAILVINAVRREPTKP